MYSRYIIDFYSIFKSPKKGPYIVLSEDSKAVSRIHWQNDMGTVIFSNDSAGSIAQAALTSGKCNTSLRFGYRSFFGHSQWHTDVKDFDSTHSHIFNEAVNIMPPEDLHCFLKNIKNMESKHGLCADGKTECFLSNEDLKIIQNEYSSYYEQEQRNGNIKYSIEDEENILLDVGVTFLNSFIKTLIDRYLKPWLMDRASEKVISSQKVIWLIDILSSLTIAIYTGSLKQSLSYTFTIKCLNKVLTLAGIDLSIAESIASGISAYCFSIKNFVSLLYIGRANCVIAGQVAGHVLIRYLPKLKYEEPADTTVDTAEVIHSEQDNVLSGGTLRRRG